MDQLINLLDREDQPFLSQLALGKLLITQYTSLPLRVISPIVTIKNITRFKGYYINPNKTIDIYGDDKVGISLELYWKNLVIYDIYNRPRPFLEKGKKGFRPRIWLKPDVHPSETTNTILMPVDYNDLKPGDIRFVDENSTTGEMVVKLDYGLDSLTIHTINPYGELDEEHYPVLHLAERFDDFYTVIRI